MEYRVSQTLPVLHYGTSTEHGIHRQYVPQRILNRRQTLLTVCVNQNRSSTKEDEAVLRCGSKLLEVSGAFGHDSHIWLVLCVTRRLVVLDISGVGDDAANKTV